MSSSSVLKARQQWSNQKKVTCSDHSLGEESAISTTSSSGYESAHTSSSVDSSTQRGSNNNSSALPRSQGRLWSQPDASCFKVRSKNYLKDGIKHTSDPYLLQARGAELFLTEDCPKNVAQKYSKVLLNGELREKPTFIVNYRFPWGVLLLYFEIPQRYVEYMIGTKTVENDGVKDKLRPSEQCICSFLSSASSVFTTSSARRNSVFKFIPVVAEGPWVVRSMVTGKPVLIGQKLPLQYFSQLTNVEKGQDNNGLAPYLEADLDVGNSSTRARNITSMCKKFMKSLTLDFGFVIQGNSFDELPEQMLGCVRLHSFDPTLAPRLPDP